MAVPPHPPVMLGRKRLNPVRVQRRPRRVREGRDAVRESAGPTRA